ncbi:menaquinone reductase, molybdopterin-binding-like subunit [Capsulimonas corticalis]|uniref:Menaquinone reductase, molybdopterin-binding-like subunit n=1 Tax=Capsulimonas corticalis TaxID=2219043 RepID=A0A402CW95_9BACT|nr:molybdopterin-dependent oxidoreductase [Capsulimonas corticalis]BDI34078.1 menaquinone reductase, molybdopterin-binding-like subunit [Capsulimonas corticalis]
MSDISRRTFIKLSMLGAASGLVAGCGVSENGREEAAGQYGGTRSHIQPYIIQPSNLVDGVSQWFASTCVMCPAGCGLIVRTMGGRATKVEGNPEHPISQGKICSRGQSTLQHLYNPLRLRSPMQRAVRSSAPAPISWDTALARIAGRLKASRGRIAILADGLSYGQSPSAGKLLSGFSEAVGASIFYYSLLDSAPWRAAAKTAHGQDSVPLYQIDQADYLLAFHSDFLETWPSPVYYGRAFGEFRQGARREAGDHGRFVYIGPRMSMTAAKADRWLPCRPGTEMAVALGILSAMGRPGLSVVKAAALSGLTEAQITRVAREFAAAGPRAIALPGDGLAALPNATEAIIAVEALNTVAGRGRTGFGFPAFPLAASSESYYAQIQRLQISIEKGEVDALLVVGQPNPVFTTPPSAGFAAALKQVPFVTAFTPIPDETTAYADLLLPSKTFLEEWGDHLPIAIPGDISMASLSQPVVDTKYIQEKNGSAPWMEPRGLFDLTKAILGVSGKPAPAADGEGFVRALWSASGANAWEDRVGVGGSWVSKPAAGALPTTPALPAYSGPRTPLPSGEFTLTLYPHLYWADGRNASAPWLQEIPDPMTMAVWNNWVEINAETAHRLGIRTGDIVRLTTDHGEIELPAIPYPAIHPEALAVPIGQGRYDFGGSQATGHSVPNPFALLPLSTDKITGALSYSGAAVRLSKVRNAAPGYDPGENTLVILQDRPGGQEPEAVKDLIHATARELRSQKSNT